MGTMGVPHHVWVSHVTLSCWSYFTCTAASSVFTLQDKRDKGKAHWMLLEIKQISRINRSLSLLCSWMVLQAGRSHLQWAAAWCTAPPAHRTSSTTGAPDGCPAPSLPQTRQGQKQGPPSWGGLLLGTAGRDRPQPLAHPPAESQQDFAQEAEGWFSTVLRQTGYLHGHGALCQMAQPACPGHARVHVHAQPVQLSNCSFLIGKLEC